MLQQIVKDMYVDPEILAELSEEQKEILFCKMREEQIRRWRINEAEYDKKMKKNKKKKKTGGKKVGWLLGKDSKEWVWVMGDHSSDKTIEHILEKERLEKAKQLAKQEAEAARIKEEKALKEQEEEERKLREEQERLAKEKAELERKAQEEEEILQKEQEAERQLKKKLAEEQAEEEERRKKAEETEKKLIEMRAKWQKTAVEEKERLAKEEKARRKEEEERLRLEEKKRQEELEKRRAEQAKLRASMEEAKRKKEQLEREKREKEQKARELKEKAEKLRQQAETERKAHEQREKHSKQELQHRTEELYNSLKKTDEDKEKMEEKDRTNIEDMWKVQLRRSKRADNERSQRARWAREEIRRSRLSGNFENLTLDEIYKQALTPQEQPIIRPASGMPRPSQPVNRADVISWYKDNQQHKQAGISVDINGKRPAKWFHGIISREKANEILETKKPGSFLVRVSEKVWGYVLSYRGQEKVKHFLIDASGETYQFFGADPTQRHSVHNRLGDLITYHKVIPISELGREILKEPCGQEGTEPDFLELVGDLQKNESTTL